MREVDTGALQRVSSSLGIAAPSSATRAVLFDDDNLQQVLEISRLVPGASIGDGWFIMDPVDSHTETGTRNFSVDVYDLADVIAQVKTPINREEQRIWAMRLHVARDIPGSGDSITFISAGVRLAYPGQLVDFPMVAAETFGASIDTAGRQVGLDTGNQLVHPINLPMRLDPGAQLKMKSIATMATAGPERAQMVWLFWVGPRGLNPPGVA